MYCHDNSTDDYHSSTTVLMMIILVLLAKHFKMKALVSMLAIQTVPLPVEAVNLTATMMSAMIAPDQQLELR